MDEPRLVLLGPTAVGKTAVSLPLAESIPAEIVSVDSRQIYRGMEIGSAAPTEVERARIPHHLVGEVEPEEGITAGEFGRRARRAMEEIRARGRKPLLVGGSGLYLHAVLGGLDEDLPRDPEVRERLRQRLEDEGTEILHAELARSDAASAEQISPRDGQRITRALEILEVTGRPASELRTRGMKDRLPARIVVLDRGRETLERRIRARVEAMVTAGLEEEVRRLLARGLPATTPALKSVGYAETVRYLNRELTRAGWVEAIVVNTRRFAKRQRTWFRGLAEAQWVEGGERETPERTAERVAALWEIAEDRG
jgi:tRNA dimethylallyltransferase